MKKVGRNDQCPCGSGRKYKHCCLKKKLFSNEDIRVIIKENNYTEEFADVLCNLLSYMKEKQWIGACHATAAVMYVALSEIGYKPILCMGEVLSDSLCFDHSWIEVDEKIVDLACSMTLLGNGNPVNQPVILNENNHMKYGISLYGLGYEASNILELPLSTYMDMYPGSKNGLWDIVSIILEKSININELRQKYANTQWIYKKYK